MDFPLSKSEKNSLKEFEQMFSEKKTITPSNYDRQKYRDIIDLMIEQKLLMKRCYDNEVSYTLVGDLQLFLSDIKEQDKKARKLSRREWKIAIISSIIGACIGLIPTIITLLGGA